METNGPHLRAQFIAMFKEPITSFLACSIIGRAQKQGVLEGYVTSILEQVNFDHHAIDDTPYGGGAGELMKIDVVAPIIKAALEKNPGIEREKKRVILMDPAGKVFNQTESRRLASYNELIFVCGRYEGIDARVHHYIDETISVGDFILSSGDIAAMAIFDATARMIPGVLNNNNSILYESHCAGRLEASQYTRPAVYDDLTVPAILKSGNHAEIRKFQVFESAKKTLLIRPELLEQYPLTSEEKTSFQTYKDCRFPWSALYEDKT